MRNEPYKKLYDQDGKLINPITKTSPLITKFPNRRQRRDMALRMNKPPKNNKKGIRLIVTNIGKSKFIKTYVEKQKIGNKVVEHYRLAS